MVRRAAGSGLSSDADTALEWLDEHSGVHAIEEMARVGARDRIPVEIAGQCQFCFATCRPCLQLRVETNEIVSLGLRFPPFVSHGILIACDAGDRHERLGGQGRALSGKSIRAGGRGRGLHLRVRASGASLHH